MDDQDLSPAQRLLLELWIPVSERLPEEGQAVLAVGPVQDSCVHDYGGWGQVEVMPAIYRADRQDGKGRFFALYWRDYLWDVCEATHWMPLAVPTAESAQSIKDELDPDVFTSC